MQDTPADPAKGQHRVTTYRTKRPDNSVFLVRQIHLAGDAPPDDAVSGLLAKRRSAIVRELSGKLVGEKPIAVDGYPAVDFVVAGRVGEPTPAEPNVSLNARVVLAPHAIIEQMAVLPKGSGADVSAFFTGLRVKPTTTPKGDTSPGKQP